MLPPGEWSALIVGDQWVDDPDLMVLLHSISSREEVNTGYSLFADMLRNTQLTTLAEQQGYTADDLRSAFRHGEEQARQVAAKNEAKVSAYRNTYDNIVCLRQDLTALAAEGNQRIRSIQDSKEPVAVKVPQIIAAIHQYRALAGITAAKCSGSVFDAIQKLLDAEGTGQSARQFAQARGLDVGRMFRSTHRDMDLEEQVRSRLTTPESPMDFGSSAKTPAERPPTHEAPMSMVRNSTFHTGPVPPKPSTTGNTSSTEFARTARTSSIAAPSAAGPPPAALQRQLRLSAAAPPFREHR